MEISKPIMTKFLCEACGLVVLINKEGKLKRLAHPFVQRSIQQVLLDDLVGAFEVMEMVTKILQVFEKDPTKWKGCHADGNGIRILLKLVKMCHVCSSILDEENRILSM